ncbi:uncharacterized protein NPIL_99251 [Nephila pilipes]|uniref:Uncharacterized protein n=1 Tax=Nephila pilipes TaxID=299642 RepID=A0A8X6P0S5_NEPPI|nr:uncharacterized protein NPIL_99251 [Nephila pilipes]
MAQIRAEEAAEQHAARLEDARLQVRQSRSAISNVLRSQQKNTIGYKWLKDVNKEKHISLTIALYFGTIQDELDARCGISTGIKRCIISQLQELFHGKNHLGRLFKTAIDMMPSDTHKIVIHADRTPAGEHVRRFNARTVDEGAIIIVGDQFQPRDIVLHQRNEQLTKIAETHRCYDALQYPILFWGWC